MRCCLRKKIGSTARGLAEYFNVVNGAVTSAETIETFFKAGTSAYAVI